MLPDLSHRVRRLATLADRAAAWSVARALLAIVALEIIVWSIRDLVAGDADASASHVVRHLGSFTLAYGVGLLVVVARPARARTMLPVAGVVAGALGITAVVDLVAGRIPLWGEILHLPEVASVVLVWLLAHPTRPAADRSDPRLRLADDPHAAERHAV